MSSPTPVLAPKLLVLKKSSPVAAPTPTYHLLDVVHSHLATRWPHRCGSGSSPGGRNGHPHRSVPGCRGVSHRVHTNPLPQPAQNPRVQGQLDPEPPAKACLPFPCSLAHPRRPAQTGLWISPPGFLMVAQGVHWAQRQGAPRYLESQPLPKGGRPRSREQGNGCVHKEKAGREGSNTRHGDGVRGCRTGHGDEQGTGAGLSYPTLHFLQGQLLVT